MQGKHRASLNAIRVFAITARTGSLRAAGAELGVTSGAVSHQLKKLEDELSVSLFRRGHNSVALTEMGRRFYEEVAPAIGLIERSADALYRDETAIAVQASTSLAVRWLIPSLDRFRALFPDVRVRVETGTLRGAPAVSDADVSIRYFRAGQAAQGWEPLACDLSRPVVSPTLVADDLNDRRTDIEGLPALQRAVGNWDWALWCEAARVRLDGLSFAHAFDTDDAALHACVAGLGVVLAPPILTSREIRSGTLIPLPGYDAVEIGTYRYRSRSDRRVVRQFCGWMNAEMRNVG